jgi:hypothetical protein
MKVASATKPRMLARMAAAQMRKARRKMRLRREARRREDWESLTGAATEGERIARPDVEAGDDFAEEVEKVKGDEGVEDLVEAGLDEASDEERGGDDGDQADAGPEEARGLGMKPDGDEKREDDGGGDGGSEDRFGGGEGGLVGDPGIEAVAGPEERGEEESEDEEAGGHAGGLAVEVGEEGFDLGP